MYGLAEKLTDYLIKNEIKEEAKREECTYGFEMLFQKAIGYGTLLLLGSALYKFIPTVVFLLTFCTLRERTGGFHMRTETGCFIVSIVQFLLIMRLGEVSIIRLPFIQLGIVLISILIIFLLAPLNHPNWNLNTEEVKQCRHLARMWTFIFAGIVVVSVYMDWFLEYIPYIVMGMGLDAGALLLGKVVRQEVNQ